MAKRFLVMPRGTMHTKTDFVTCEACEPAMEVSDVISHGQYALPRMRGRINVEGISFLFSGLDAAHCTLGDLREAIGRRLTPIAGELTKENER